MDRYTRKDAERAFERLVSATGHRQATSWDDVGGWQLDHAACYGGYMVTEIGNIHGGVSCPFGETRRTAKEFCYAVNFAIRAIEATLTQMDFDVDAVS